MLRRGARIRDDAHHYLLQVVGDANPRLHTAEAWLQVLLVVLRFAAQ